MNNNQQFLPQAYQDSLKIHYKLSSIKTIGYNIKRIYKELFVLNSFTNLEPLFNTNQVIDWISNQPLSTKQNLLTAILALLRYPPKDVIIDKETLNKYDKYATEVIKKIKAEKNFHKLNEKEDTNWLPWGTIINLYNNYKKAIQSFINTLPKNKEDIQIFQRYIILLLYTQIPPLRPQEYLDAYVSNFPIDVNYEDEFIKIPNKNIMDLSNKKFIVKYHKTMDSHGTKIIDLPNTVVNDLKEWRHFNGFQNYLFISPLNHEPLTRLGLLQQFHKIFEPYKVKIGPTMLRKIYISEMLNQKITNEERKKIAMIMGHTIETQEFTYKKNE